MMNTQGNLGSWTKVEDRLPKSRYAVLVYCPESENIYCAYYTGDKEAEGIEDKSTWYYFGQQLFTAVQEKVTHWRDLPELPEKES